MIDRKTFRITGGPGLVALAVTLACGGGPGASSPGPRATPTLEAAAPPWATLAIDPAEADVSVGAALPMRALLGLGAASDVAWSVAEGEGGGHVDASGIYASPGVPGTVHVTATAASQVATAAIHVKAGGAIALIPNPARAKPHGTLAFQAVVTGLADTGVTWSLVEGAAAGTVSEAGVYTAGPFGRYHVVATSVADPTVRAVVEVEVSDDLQDFGGSVLDSPTVHAIWGGDPAQFGDAVDAVERFLGGIDGSPWAALLGAYLRGSAPHVTFGGSAFVPGSALGGQPGAPEVLAAVCDALDALGVAPRSEDVYLLFSPVLESGTAYWGTHWWGPCHGVPISAAWIARRSLADGCGSASPEARAATFVVSHELAEAMTDPDYFRGWATRDGREIADGCAQACVTLGGAAFTATALWSNTVHGCTGR